MKKINLRGFTLIEIVVTIALLAVVVAVAVPSYRQLAASNRATAVANDLLTALQMARSEASRAPGVGVQICASSSGTSCGGAWSDGWLVWADWNGNNAINVCAGDNCQNELVRAWPAPGQGFTVTLPAGTVIVFNADGSAASSGSFTIQGGGTTPQVREVSLLLSGRATVVQPVE
jgi:type IV fimbrial biogenesis protein FimT